MRFHAASHPVNGVKPPRPVGFCIPWFLLSVRVVMTPFILFAPPGLTDHAILWLYVIAFVTDYFDGASARYFGTATPILRKADSTADTVFFLAIGSLIVRRHPQEFAKNAPALVTFLAAVVVWYALDAIRWHRPAGFHTYSSKLLAAALLVWFVTLFGGWRTGHLLSFVLIYGTAVQLEGIAISLLLRKDRPDVPTFVHAMRLRREAFTPRAENNND